MCLDYYLTCILEEMAKSLTKFKQYDIHSITTCFEGTKNANIASWVMQTDMKAKVMAVALYEPDFTLELVQQSGILNVNLLAVDQHKLISRLGRKSGRQTDKFKTLLWANDSRGCPYLTEAIGYFKCNVHSLVPAGDHMLAICNVLGQYLLHPQKDVLTLSYLREHKLVRG